MWDWIRKAEELRNEGKAFALVTVIGAKGSTPQKVGAKMIVKADGTIFGTIGGGNLEQLGIEEAKKHLSEASSGQQQYPLCFRTGQCCGGAVELLTEVVGSEPQLYIFGAGHVAQAICSVLRGTPFRIHLIDERPEWLTEAKGLSHVTTHEGHWSNFLEKPTWNPRDTYIAIMTHDHNLDLEILEKILKNHTHSENNFIPRYIGLIGSETKWDRFQQRLKAHGINEHQLSRVTCPIGSGKFGKAPQEVAISFAFELMQKIYGK